MPYFTNDETNPVDIAWAEWIAVDVEPFWTTVKSKNKRSGFPTSRQVRFTRGTCLVDGCGFKHRGQIKSNVERKMEAHAEAHVRALEGNVKPVDARKADPLPDLPPF